MRSMSFAIAFTLLLTAFLCIPVSTSATDDIDTDLRFIEDSMSLINEDAFVYEVCWTDFISEKDDSVSKQPDGFYLSKISAASFEVNIPEDGKYHLQIRYRFESDWIQNESLIIRWKGGEFVSALSGAWTSERELNHVDRYGNEITPEPGLTDISITSYIRDLASLAAAPYTFELSEGVHRFYLFEPTVPVAIEAVTVLRKLPLPSYSSEISPPNVNGTEPIVIEGEDYILKSDSHIRAANSRSSYVYPRRGDVRLLNVLDGSSWKHTGQKVTWTFMVDVPGFYGLSFRYSQDSMEGIPVVRNIAINGVIPFKHFNNFLFPYTGNRFETLTMSENDGRPQRIWLDRGRHIISMEADAAPYSDIILNLRKIVTELNDIGIEIRKVTGNNRDFNRTWNITRHIPDIAERLNGWADDIESSFLMLHQISETIPAIAVNLRMASASLRDLADNPEQIPTSLSRLNAGSGSAAQMLSDFTIRLSEQPLSIDRIVLFSTDMPPVESVSFFDKVWAVIKSFVMSFFGGSQSHAVTANMPEDELQVWVNRPIQFVETMQQLTDVGFTPQSGVKVRFSVMPNEQKLILSNASGTNPDAALGVSLHIPYEMALRGALHDLTQFEDFLPTVARDFKLESLIPFWVDEGIYGIAETQDFYVLMYRKDVLDKLDLPIPQTWDDVKEMMPVLQRYSMNFFLPMAGWTGLKPLHTTAPFLFQNGANLYAPDGLSSDISSDEALRGFELMTELFTIYGVAIDSPNFYSNFRQSMMPVGIANFSTYVMLTHAAPEIARLWDIALSPGIQSDEGDIVRYQVAADRAGIIFSNSQKKDEAWQFIRWWLSRSVQVRYSQAMQARFGPEYMWNTANVAAFSELDFPSEHKEVILEQWSWAREIPRHPAGYMLERAISNAWTEVVLNGESARIALDRATMTVNREIIRKLEEFGYISNGRVVREYRIPSVEEIRKLVLQNQ